MSPPRGGIDRRPATSGRLRIIGGRFRRRLLPVPDAPGLRPTPDRVRETLFNWLAPLIAGSRCLDLFAGTGALGLEAASRGADSVVLIERAEPVAQQLRETVRLLGATGVQVVQADALRWLAEPGWVPETRPFDLVFLDPPFTSGLLGPACDLLERHHWLAPGARIYLETAQATGLPPLPPVWELTRDRTGGQVRFALAQVRTSSDPRLRPAHLSSTSLEATDP